MKALRIVLWSVLGVVVLAAVGIAIFVATFDANAWKPKVAALVQEKTGRTLSIDGDVSVRIFPKIGAAVGKTTLSGPRGAGTFASVDEVRVALALLPLLSRQVVVDQVVLRGLRLDLVKHKDGSTNFDDLTGADRKPAQPSRPSPADGQSPAQLDVSGIVVTDGNVRWRDEQAGTTTVVSGLELKTGRIADRVPAELALAARVEQPPATTTIKFATGYRIDFAQTTLALDKLRGDIGMTGGARPLAIAVTGASSVNWGKQLVHADLSVDAEAMRLAVKADITGFSPPHVRFDVAADKLDVDAFTGATRGASAPPTAPKGGAQPQSKPAASAPEKPIDLSALKSLRADGRVRVGMLVVGGIHAQKLDTTVKAANGRLALDPIAASLYDGTLAGSVLVSANEDRYTVKQRLADIAVGPLLRDAARQDLIEGRGNVTLDLDTHGRTVSALKRALGGSARIVLRDGALKGVNLGQIARQAQALSRGDTQGLAAAKSEKTDFTEMTVSFAIRDGIARSDDLDAKAPLLRLGGEGQVDVAAGTVDYTLRATIAGTSTGQGGKTLDQVRSVTVPIMVKGPFEALRYEVDAKALAREALKDEASRRLGDALKGRVDDQTRGRIGDALKGLLGR